MVSTFTPNKNIEQPARNDAVNTWDVPVNGDWTQIDKAFGNSTSLNATGLSGNQTLTIAQYVPLTLIISGAPTAAITYVVPTGVGGQWVVANATTGGFTVGIRSNAGGTTIPIPAGTNTLVSCDGSATGMRLSINTPPPAAGATTQVQFNSAGVLGGSASLTWDGIALAATGLAVNGNSVLGLNAGSTLQLTGTAVAIPNNLNIGSGKLFINGTSGNVGLGTVTPGSPLTVAGTIESTAGGVKFPDGSIQTTAGIITGAILDYIGTTPPTGWVLGNAQTIGDATSGATGRANADTVALFTLLWNSWANAQAPVSGGRGASAAADYAAHKTIQLPDLRGTVIAGLDNLGAVGSAGRLSSVMASTTPGAALSNTGLAAATTSVSFTSTGTNNFNFGSIPLTGGTQLGDFGIVFTAASGTTPVAANGATSSVSGNVNVNGNFGVTVSGGGNFNSGNFGITQSTMVMAKIIKL